MGCRNSSIVKRTSCYFRAHPQVLWPGPTWQLSTVLTPVQGIWLPFRSCCQWAWVQRTDLYISPPKNQAHETTFKKLKHNVETTHVIKHLSPAGCGTPEAEEGAEDSLWVQGYPSLYSDFQESRVSKNMQKLIFLAKWYDVPLVIWIGALHRFPVDKIWAISHCDTKTLPGGLHRSPRKGVHDPRLLGKCFSAIWPHCGVL